jgi:4-hydroxybenzoyl-CoA reductase subunit beta
MLRLPTFGYHVPASIDEALRMKVDAGDKGMFVAGGTDLYPNMKRRHQDPTTVISLSGIGDLKKPPSDNSDALSLGPGISLTALERDEDIRSRYPVVARTAELISTPLLRNMGTLGGNLCLDTRCNYYNQTYEWRRAIDFCMKKDGSVCWVAPRSPRCWAVNSSDLAPVMVALGADYVLVGPGGERVVPAGSFYRNDGIDYLAKQPHEILTEVRLPPTGSWDATYWKLRRRGSFDFRCRTPGSCSAASRVTPRPWPTRLEHWWDPGSMTMLSSKRPPPHSSRQSRWTTRISASPGERR